MVHPQYDLAHWRERWPFDRWAALPGRSPGTSPLDGSAVFSPRTIAINQQIRDRLWPDLDATRGVPCDLFAWGWGPPPQPHLTKIGGTPYMDDAEEWPRDDEGNPMAFVFQVNFRDSLDLFPAGLLPGDLLLFFSKVWVPSAKDVYLAFDERPTTHHFRWVRSAEVRRPVANAPETGLNLWPLHGVIHRSFDIPELDVRNVMAGGVDVFDHPIYGEVGEVSPPAIWWSTKIGGVPRWEQGEDLGMTPPGGTFLCQFLSDRAHHSFPDPYEGHPEPFPPEELWPARIRQLRIGDVGSAYLFLVDGQVYFCSQS